MRSIDKHLSRKRSRGAYEKKGGSFRLFDEADLDIKYMLALFKNRSHPFQKIGCIPDVRLCVFRNKNTNILKVTQNARPRSGFTLEFDVRAGVLIRFKGKEGTIYVPDKLDLAIQRCRDMGKRFVILNLGLHERDLSDGHSNSLVLDLERNVIERYEPHGFVQGRDDVVRDLLKSVFPNLKYIGPVIRKGAQQRVDLFTGMCVTFSLLYTLLRLSNPHLTKQEIERELVHGTHDSIQDRILRLNAHVAETLRGHRGLR